MNVIKKRNWKLRAVTSFISFMVGPPTISATEPRLAMEQMVKTISELSALPVGTLTDLQTVHVQWFERPQEGGGGTFFWSAKSDAADDGGLVINPKHPGPGRWIRVLEEPGVLSPLYFGAHCDGHSDDTHAVNQSLTAIRRTVVAGDMQRQSGVLRMPARQCIIENTINATKLSSVTVLIEGSGGSLLCRTSGRPCIDAIDSARLSFRDVSLYGDRDRMPSTGLQVGRPSPHGSAAGMYLDHVSISGYFSFTAFYNLNAETQLDVKLNASNAAPGGFGAVYDGLNHWNAQSAFVSITSPTETMQSFNDNTCINCRITSSGVGGVPIWMAGTAELTFDNSYISNFNSGPGVILYGLNTNPHFDAHFEATGLTSVFVLSGSKHLVVFGLHYSEHDFFGSRSMFALDQGTETAKLENVDINIGRHHLRDGGAWFDKPGSYTVSGRVAGVTDRGWSLPGGGFSGTACFFDRCTSYVANGHQ